MKTTKWILLSSVSVVLGLALIGALIPTSASTPNTALDPALTQHLPPLIRTMGLRCHTLSHMRLHAKTERGDVFKAVCDEDTSYYQYRILYTPSGQMTIRPWSE